MSEPIRRSAKTLDILDRYVADAERVDGATDRVVTELADLADARLAALARLTVRLRTSEAQRESWRAEARDTQRMLSALMVDWASFDPDEYLRELMGE